MTPLPHVASELLISLEVLEQRLLRVVAHLVIGIVVLRHRILYNQLLFEAAVGVGTSSVDLLISVDFDPALAGELRLAEFTRPLAWLDLFDVRLLLLVLGWLVQQCRTILDLAVLLLFPL